MRLHVSIEDENGTRQYESADVQDLRDAADLLRSIAFEHDPASRTRPGSDASVKRLNLTWEA